MKSGESLFRATNYHVVLFPISVVYAPDVLRSGRGGLLADLVRVAYRIGKQVARGRAAAPGLGEHDEPQPVSRRLLGESVSTSLVYYLPNIEITSTALLCRFSERRDGRNIGVISGKRSLCARS